MARKNDTEKQQSEVTLWMQKINLEEACNVFEIEILLSILKAVIGMSEAEILELIGEFEKEHQSEFSQKD